MTDKTGPKTGQRSWNHRIATDGGPVGYLNIYDGQAQIRIPEEVNMGRGIYRYEHTTRTYHWIPRTPDA